MKPVRMVLPGVLVLLLAGSIVAQDFPKPGPEHEQLKQMAGTWDAQVKFFPEPGKPPQESKGEYTAKLDVGGYFLTTEVKGQMFPGQPFHGRGITGYDSFKKKYTGVWVDSMSPAIYTTQGAFDRAGKVFTETMEGPDPTGKPMKMTMTTEIKSKDSMIVKMFAPGEGGKTHQVMEILYTRRK